MNWDENIEVSTIFYISGFLFVSIGLILMYIGYNIWSYEAIAMGVVFLLLGIDANKKPTN